MSLRVTGEQRGCLGASTIYFQTQLVYLLPQDQPFPSSLIIFSNVRSPLVLVVPYELFSFYQYQVNDYYRLNVYAPPHSYVEALTWYGGI